MSGNNLNNLFFIPSRIISHKKYDRLKKRSLYFVKRLDMFDYCKEIGKIRVLLLTFDHFFNNLQYHFASISTLNLFNKAIKIIC